jgi:protein TonB
MKAFSRPLFVILALALIAGCATPPKIQLPPVAILQPAPRYPFEMRKAGVSGEVQLVFIVDVDGNTRDVHALKSTNLVFERAAIEAVEQWKFKPGTIDGRPINTRSVITIPFTIIEDTPPAAPTGK